MMVEERECKQCGTCCRKGGPALHGEDLGLVGRQIALDQLICVRQGEPSLHPLAGEARPAREEFVKVAGKAGSWECLFLSREGLCRLHPDKPLQCRTLECWQPQPLLDLLERDLVKRRHLLEPSSPLLSLIAEQEESCSFARLTPYLELERGVDEEFIKLINLDLKLRERGAKEHGLSLNRELLFLGRPLFKTLQAAGWHVWQEGDRLLARP
ncbi:MAG: YkgJ family cysteine cluster protein [Thermodesulfobacteriota bacterium]